MLSSFVMYLNKSCQKKCNSFSFCYITHCIETQLNITYLNIWLHKIITISNNSAFCLVACQAFMYLADIQNYCSLHANMNVIKQ